MYSNKILILIPHPDDEVVGCGIAIQRAIKQGCKVSGIYLTHGCIPFAQLWKWQQYFKSAYKKKVACRLNEAKIAAKVLGLDIYSLEQNRAARELWPNLIAIWQEITAAIEILSPDVLWVPAYEGGNPDHDALNGLAALLYKKFNVPIFEFAEYTCQNKQKFLTSIGTESIIQLTDEEKIFKKKLLSIYRSQSINLRRFKSPTQEQFRPLSLYNYSEPPERSTLWYERYRWLPLYYPGVDYTSSKIICKKIELLRDYCKEKNHEC